jgi:hypothetical protein
MKMKMEISPETTVEGFKKYWISNVMNGTGDMLWNVSEEGVNVRSECEGDEGTACEEGDSDTDWYK